MATGHRRCKHCGKRIYPRPQNPNQQYCTQPECQKERKRQWQRQKMKTDPAYQENQRDAARKWRAKNPDYWRNYRNKRKEYTRRNREQQKQRNQRRGRNAGSGNSAIANMDVSDSKNNINSGRYHLIPVTGELVANMDASIVEINVIRRGYL